MRKYYYYYYVFETGFGCGVHETDDSGFNVGEVTKAIREKYGNKSTISFWAQISEKEYLKMIECINQ